MNKKTIFISLGLLSVATVSILMISARCKKKDNSGNIAIVRRFIAEVVNGSHFGGAFAQMHLEIREIVAADGKHAKWEGMGIYRIRNGKIAEAQFSEDLLAMFLQLGLLHLPG